MRWQEWMITLNLGLLAMWIYMTITIIILFYHTKTNLWEKNIEFPLVLIIEIMAFFLNLKAFVYIKRHGSLETGS